MCTSTAAAPPSRINANLSKVLNRCLHLVLTADARVIMHDGSVPLVCKDEGTFEAAMLFEYAAGGTFGWLSCAKDSCDM
jgi:hypothetical protein